MRDRLLGFDLARGYAIFGMYVVNFLYVFGSIEDPTPVGRFMRLFGGNSSSAFVMLAGLGCSLLAGRPDAPGEERARRRRIIVRRSWFLFAIGLLLFPWWPADILHFYGGYMHLAAFLVFVSARRLWIAALACIVIFHLLLFVIPYERGWNFDTLEYRDFWSIEGFLRNTFYNGWNPIFPWAAYFFVGMALGRLDWNSAATMKRVFGFGALAFGVAEAAIFAGGRAAISDEWRMFLTADYLPPFLPFLVSTGGFAAMLIAVTAAIGKRFADSTALTVLARTGRHTLTHYIAHLTIGMLVLGACLDRTYGDVARGAGPDAAWKILAFALAWFGISIAFSTLWQKRFPYGPLETVMRRIAG